MLEGKENIEEFVRLGNKTRIYIEGKELVLPELSLEVQGKLLEFMRAYESMSNPTLEIVDKSTKKFDELVSNILGKGIGKVVEVTPVKQDSPIFSHEAHYIEELMQGMQKGYDRKFKGLERVIGKLVNDNAVLQAEVVNLESGVYEQFKKFDKAVENLDTNVNNIADNQVLQGNLAHGKIVALEKMTKGLDEWLTSVSSENMLTSSKIYKFSEHIENFNKRVKNLEEARNIEVFKPDNIELGGSTAITEGFIDRLSEMLHRRDIKRLKDNKFYSPESPYPMQLVDLGVDAELLGKQIAEAMVNLSKLDARKGGV